MTDEQQQPSGPHGVRASDQEREEIVNTLKQHMVDGRLDWEEFSERMDKAYAARDRDELSALVGDLPGREKAAAGQAPGEGAWSPGQWGPPWARGGRGPARAWMGAGRRWPPVPVLIAIVLGALFIASTIGRLIAFGLWGGGPWGGPGHHAFGFFPFFPLFPLLWIGAAVFVVRRLSRRW
jgi:hypothetical protein